MKLVFGWVLCFFSLGKLLSCYICCSSFYNLLCHHHSSLFTFSLGACFTGEFFEIQTFHCMSAVLGGCFMRCFLYMDLPRLVTDFRYGVQKASDLKFLKLFLIKIFMCVSVKKVFMVLENFIFAFNNFIWPFLLRYLDL